MLSSEGWDRCWSDTPGNVPLYFDKGEHEKLYTLREELFHKYLLDIDEVNEFGCGIGHNLAPLLGTGKRLRGFDWSIEALRRVQAAGIEAYEFDMLNPWPAPIPGAVLTVHSMEQLGDRWRPFLDYLMEESPEIVIHIEPIEELYDDSPRDQARLAFHRKRGYLTGYLTALRKMEKAGELELIEVRKSPFGGKDHDAYSVVVWKPV